MLTHRPFTPPTQFVIPYGGDLKALVQEIRATYPRDIRLMGGEVQALSRGRDYNYSSEFHESTRISQNQRLGFPIRAVIRGIRIRSCS
ncbi:MAG TPA: hypothetical protein VFT29_11090 [Gemmatimonadaceae bacterium]|nr:hypothetical protein [Gemmatimonadaceae bacterium]